MSGRNNLEYCRMLSSDANDLDRRFGEFCFNQVRKQLKGAYLPEERIYCIEAAGEDKNRGGIPCAGYNRQRRVALRRLPKAAGYRICP